MKNKIEQITKYIQGTQFSDLPDNVVHEMKRVILDSIGCAISGHVTGRGQAAISVVKKSGGYAEATVFGISEKVNCVDAAFANGESMNALDNDALSTAVVHDVPVIIPATVALGENVKTSGINLILATTTAFEVSARLKAAGAGPSKSKSGTMEWPPVLGYSAVTIAASAGACKIMGMDKEKTANAIAIAAGIASPNIFRNFLERSPIKMIKYGAMGWQAKTAITATFLAKEGYSSYTDVLDGDYGFYRYTGMGGVPENNAAEIFSDMGTKWTCHQIRYKRYPACGHLLPAIDKFIKIINEYNIKPDAITGIHLHLDALSNFTIFQKNNIESPDDYCFYAPYLLACAAHHISPEQWHHDNIKKDSKINEFMQRVKFQIIPDEREAGITEAGNVERKSQMRIKVQVKGNTYEQKLEAIPHLSDHELVDKFVENVSGFLPSDRAEIAAEQIFNLDKAADVSQLLEIFQV